MTALEKINKMALHEYLSKGWLTHDGMWFFNTLAEFGIDAANRLNMAAIKSMAIFEIERSKKALGIHDNTFTSFDEFKDFLLGSLELLMPAAMKLKFVIPRINILRWEWGEEECFAYKGMKRIGVIDKYQCGVIYRIECWLEQMEIKYLVSPKPCLCLMANKGACAGEFEFYFNE